MTNKIIQIKDRFIRFISCCFDAIEVTQRSGYLAEKSAIERWNSENPPIGSESNPLYVCIAERDGK
jgi:hypothetical protein